MDEIEAIKVETSATYVLDFSEPFHEFNGKGILQNVRFGTLNSNDDVATVTFQIPKVINNEVTDTLVTKWNYASVLTPVLTEGAKGMLRYNGGEVEIVNGVVTALT